MWGAGGDEDARQACTRRSISSRSDREKSLASDRGHPSIQIHVDVVRTLDTYFRLGTPIQSESRSRTPIDSDPMNDVPLLSQPEPESS